MTTTEEAHALAATLADNLAAAERFRRRVIIAAAILGFLIVCVFAYAVISLAGKVNALHTSDRNKIDNLTAQVATLRADDIAVRAAAQANSDALRRLGQTPVATPPPPTLPAPVVRGRTIRSPPVTLLPATTTTSVPTTTTTTTSPTTTTTSTTTTTTTRLICVAGICI